MPNHSATGGSDPHRSYDRCVVSPFMSDTDKLAAVRAALPSLSAAIQLNTGSAGPLPAEVAAAMAELEAYERDFGRAQFDYYLESLQRMDEARAGVAAVLGGELDEVAITHAATDGMNLGTWSIDWRDGGRAVTTCHEHAGGVGPLYSICDRFGVDLGFAEFSGDASDDEIVEQFRPADHARHEARRALARPVDDRPGHARRPDRRPRPRARRAGARRRCAGGRRDPGERPRPRRRHVRDPGAEVAARAGRPWRALGPTGAVRHHRPELRRLLLVRELRLPRESVGPAGRATVPGHQLPPAVGGRDGPGDRLADDVRRPRLRPRAGAPRWPIERPTFSRRSTASRS